MANQSGDYNCFGQPDHHTPSSCCMRMRYGVAVEVRHKRPKSAFFSRSATNFSVTSSSLSPPIPLPHPPMYLAFLSSSGLPCKFSLQACPISLAGKKDNTISECIAQKFKIDLNGVQCAMPNSGDNMPSFTARFKLKH